MKRFELPIFLVAGRICWLAKAHWRASRLRAGTSLSPVGGAWTEGKRQNEKKADGN
jgi:hypothetical protein